MFNNHIKTQLFDNGFPTVPLFLSYYACPFTFIVCKKYFLNNKLYTKHYMAAGI